MVPKLDQSERLHVTKPAYIIVVKIFVLIVFIEGGRYAIASFIVYLWERKDQGRRHSRLLDKERRRSRRTSITSTLTVKEPMM